MKKKLEYFRDYLIFPLHEEDHGILFRKTPEVIRQQRISLPLF